MAFDRLPDGVSPDDGDEFGREFDSAGGDYEIQDATLWDGLKSMFGPSSFLSTRAKVLAAAILVAGFVLVPLLTEIVSWALVGMGVPVWVVVGVSALYTIVRRTTED